ncbi:GNAT family N-acetyltransferase [Alkalibacterium sp. f15]|uniref:GNAT family N-acetyltransferase n=1 Tax=Alkalibacterium sp. f15 TaxID=3414029 RepID=UPI003BF8B77F
MTEHIRQLTAADLIYYEKMQTGLDDDYMLPIFDRITSGANYLYGLFESDKLLALSGFTLFKDYYAMLGRLRTDQRFRKSGYGTKIVEYSLNQALAHPDVKWIGANTEQHNQAAQSLLKKVGLPPVKLLYAAQTTTLEALVTNAASLWKEETNKSTKMNWIRQTYLHPLFDKKVFPLEAYYPFPVSEEMFEDSIDQWHFFENEDKTRCVIMWEEFKGVNYLHVVYPWHDFMNQPGLFNTVQQELSNAQKKDSQTKTWWDFSETDVALLPNNHPFKLDSPWILHGLSKEALLTDDISDSVKRANELIQKVESELNDLEQILDQEADTIESLSDQLKNNEESL